MYWHFAGVVVDIDRWEVRSRAGRILLRATSGSNVSDGNEK
jgi:hypothetical protein